MASALIAGSLAAGSGPAGAAPDNPSELAPPGLSHVRHPRTGHPLRDASGRPLLTHGGDAAVAASDRAASAPVPTGPAPCIGDGVSGPRLSVIYGLPSNEHMFTAEGEARVRDSINQTHEVFRAGGGTKPQNLRWECTGGQVLIRRVVINGCDINSYISTLQALGHTRNDRIYVGVIPGLGSCGYPYGGESTIDRDSQPLADNANSHGASYNMSADAYWGYIAHEIGHGLGAVQPGAPHSGYGGSCGAAEGTGSGFHGCEQEDLMMYEPSPSITSCPGAGGWTVDCNKDDYYNPYTAAQRPLGRVGKWLGSCATPAHWNIARSSYMTQHSDCPPVTTTRAQELVGTAPEARRSFSAKASGPGSVNVRCAAATGSSPSLVANLVVQDGAGVTLANQNLPCDGGFTSVPFTLGRNRSGSVVVRSLSGASISYTGVLRLP